MINNHAFVDTSQTPLLLTGESFVIWPGQLIYVNYSKGNTSYFNKEIYQPTLIAFQSGATLTIKDANETTLLTVQTFVDDFANEYKYRLGNGPNSLVITAIVALITSCLLMLAIFYKREIILWGDKKQQTETLSEIKEGQNK